MREGALDDSCATAASTVAARRHRGTRFVGDVCYGSRHFGCTFPARIIRLWTWIALGQLDSSDPRIDQGETFAALADVGLAVTVLLGAIGTYMVAHDASPPSLVRIGRPRVETR